MQEAPETVQTSLIQVSDGVYQIFQAQPARPGRHCSSSRRRASTTTASLLAEAIWPGHDMWVRDFSEFGGLLEGTAMWPQATPDDLDPRT